MKTKIKELDLKIDIEKLCLKKDDIIIIKLKEKSINNKIAKEIRNIFNCLNISNEIIITNDSVDIKKKEKNE